MTAYFYFGFYGWQFVVVATTCLNWYRIDVLKSKPNYFGSNWSRAIFGLICLVLMTIEKGFDPASDFLYQMWKVSPEIVYIWSSFYLFFDPGLSGLRGRKWNYRGKDSGVLDNLPLVFYYALKVLCLVALVISLIIIL